MTEMSAIPTNIQLYSEILATAIRKVNKMNNINMEGTYVYLQMPWLHGRKHKRQKRKKKSTGIL